MIDFKNWTDRRRWLAHFALALVTVGAVWLLALLLFDKVIMPHVVGSGTALVEVPSVVGKSPDEAETLLRSMGLDPVLDPELKHSETVPLGNIAMQSPMPGARVKAGHAVRYWTSSGRTAVVVPDVTGQDSALAARAIQEAGLTLGPCSHNYDNSTSAGKILGTTPQAGTSMDPGAKVSLIVSLGLEAPAEPADGSDEDTSSSSSQGGLF